MVKANRQQEKTNFLENPDNVAIGDWVKYRGKIGKIESQVETEPRMLKYWVQFIDGGIEGILASNLRKANQPTNAYKSIRLVNVTIDLQLQQRVKLDPTVIDDYAIAYGEGTELPPITVWKCTDQPGNRQQGTGNSEDNKVYLVDGFHRLEAAKQAGIEALPFIEKSGTYREALLLSLGVNATHGLRRSNADKRKAVMTLFNDSEWSQWSEREIARKTSTSQPFVSKLRQDILNLNPDTFAYNGNLTDNVISGNSKNDNGNLTDNIISGNSKNDNGNLTDNIISGNQESNEEVTRTYITKDGVKAKMRVGNIGKSKLSESLVPVEDNEIISEQLSEDIEVEVTTSGFEENNHTDDSDPVEIDNVQTDAAELTDSTNTKRRKGKQKLTNPLSVGDKVKVKDGHYFGGREGVVTQISSPHSVIVAFDDDQRELIRLLDLDLPESLQKPQLSKPKKPQKKEILIKEGLNYKAGIPGYGCKWYIEVEEEDYRLFQEYQRQINAPTLGSCLVRAVEGQKQQKSPIKTDDLLVNLSSKISYLNKQQKLFLAQKLIESDSDILNQLINQQYGK